MEKNDLPAAAKVLEKLPAADRRRAGILSALVTLHLALEDRPAAARLLKDAAANAGAAAANMDIVWRKTAEFHLKGDEPQVILLNNWVSFLK